MIIDIKMILTEKRVQTEIYFCPASTMFCYTVAVDKMHDSYDSLVLDMSVSMY